MTANRKSFQLPSDAVIKQIFHFGPSYATANVRHSRLFQESLEFKKLPNLFKFTAATREPNKIKIMLEGEKKAREYRAKDKAKAEAQTLNKSHEAKVTEELKATPCLLLQRGQFTDSAGRIFKNASALEYAWWAYDRHMVMTMIACLSPAEKIEALQQIEDLEMYGLEFEEPWADEKTRQKKQSHFNFSPLIQAYEAYFTKPSRAAWLKIGVEQSRLPLHVLNEFCRKDRSMSSLSQNRFEELSLPRCFAVEHFYDPRELSCWPFAGDLVLGRDYTLVRGELGDAGARPLSYTDGYHTLAPDDLAAIRRLHAVRHEELNELRLEKLDHVPKSALRQWCVIL